MVWASNSLEETVAETTRVRAGQLFMVGVPGPSLDRATRSFLKTHAVSGVVLFRRNITDVPALVALTGELHAISPDRPILVAIDHEGGRVSRLGEPFTFRRAIQEGIDALMTAHVVFTALDAERPATLSRRILTELLRERLRFRGVLFSDDLQMKAIADRFAPGDAAIAAIEAGADWLLTREKPAFAQQSHTPPQRARFRRSPFA